jgi:hypothetical protein
MQVNGQLAAALLQSSSGGSAMSGQLALTVLMGVFLVGVAVWLARIENWRSYTPLARARNQRASSDGLPP